MNVEKLVEIYYAVDEFFIKFMPYIREFGIYLIDLQKFNINYLVNICTYLTSFYI
ncbi:hypothetical protein [Cardinium endosymbiont of Oedothorax gibbosus]|uniref:hypothetical protein n=1 Tax=Cardinium endosymbiont of Oedothorax gibbosus TaxID=931101 RepID=UPI002023C7B3|nr:hypothetical protein [Cardinium endosymbiont of Oedothorax gibbosus]